MKKILLLPFSILLLGACAANTPFLRPEAAAVPFIGHEGPGAFENVLAQNLPYENFKMLRGLLEEYFGRKLNFYQGWNPQGEAHVTVITPVEYWQILRPYLTMQEINTIAVQNHIQASAPQVLGMGAGRAETDGQTEETYFVIMRAPELLKLRRAVQKEFVKRGGAAEAFDPEDFYPHVTVAFTKRDLHIQDGVIKDMAHSYSPQLDPLLQKAFAN